MCYQFEVAPSTNTRHVQGYIYYANKKSFAQANDVFVSNQIHPHIEGAKGSSRANKIYCSKEGGTGFTEIGEMPVQGKKRKIDEALLECSNGIVSGDLSIDDIVQTSPDLFVLHHKGLTALRAHLIKPRDASVQPVVHWWFGPTGTGKSRRARELYPTAYWKMGGNKWWDGYEGEVEVIIDDYRTSFSTFEYLLNMLDRYPMRVEYKGGSVNLAALTFVITTPKRPELTWSMRTDEALNQLIRRITDITEFLPNGEQKIWKDQETPYVMVEHVPPTFVQGFRPLQER